MAQPVTPKCPKCGTVMCEQFDDREIRGMTMAVPTGRYKCYQCGHEQGKAKPAPGAQE